ncbi:MAG: hypothetical protein ABIK48_01215 [candidate division WOR-3 bacterium]
MQILISTLLILMAPPEVTVLRWLSPNSSRPLSYQEFVARQPLTDRWQVSPLAGAGSRFDPRVDILIQDSLVSALNPWLDTLYADLTGEGYSVAAFAITGTSPESLRAFFVREYQYSSLTAAILIGNLPVPWFQLIDDWNSNGRRDPDEHYEEFPCDLFLMDLDGTWLDTLVRLDTLDSLVPGSDRIHDTHYGAIEPEIGISRIYISTISPDISLIQQYLARLHAYRTGRLQIRDRALTYIDDDWTPWAGEWNSHVGLLYPERVFVADSEQTRVRDYKPRIDTAAYQWIQLCAHSWPGGHAMKYNHSQSWDWFYGESIPRINPEACFYNLFACSNVRFVETGYCGGRYVFQSSSGLAAIGSTKTGSMLEFQDFYLPLAGGEPLALAFRDWFTSQAQGGFEPWERSWFYGMCLIGDGMLKPRFLTAVADLPDRKPGTRLQPSIYRLPVITVPDYGLLLDRSGRKVAKLSPGLNWLVRISSGVYFLKTADRPLRRVLLLH